MKRPASISIEPVFNEFVKSMGGELVSNLVGESPGFSNADYLFRSRGVVAELKCLTKDVLANKDYQRDISEMYERWVSAGKLQEIGFGTFKLETAKLPAECQREFFQLIRKPLQTAIKKANAQIKQTKARLGLMNAKGLLLLVNDGCYSIESDAIPFLTEKILGQQCTSINSIVFFTVNMPARMPGVERDILVWIPMHRIGFETVPQDFMTDLQKSWCGYYEKLIGQEVPTISVSDNKQIETVKFIRPRKSPTTFVPGCYYTDGRGGYFRCIEVIGELARLIRFNLIFHGQQLSVEFSQNVKYAPLYSEFDDQQKIKQLEDLFVRMKRRKL
ncbi:MAG: hypothetical protein ABSC89_08355 [Verrucomicrobiota bacterium]|jgi:hypothetical protein